MSLARNLELKARVPSLDHAHQVARRLATSQGGALHQVDTYFYCANGRLKLREIREHEAQLIWYARANAAVARESQYRLVRVPEAAALKAALAAALGVRVVVEKHRALYFFANVRLHLDTVVGLGSFLEFEAVLAAEAMAANEERQLAFLCQEFGISGRNIEPRSYADLLSPVAETGEV